ncbi:MAG: pyridoxamine 5'-phosphate oxidase family protein [Chitinispirillales bacterium]|jgi:pyridoxamine 5'-phosphate oxidase|nr:pyridoxamine 5'-phosphate oxidase family protein [Chitinispirillales bacterium]
MNKHEFMSMMQRIVDESHAAVLASADKEGRPHIRWIVPGLLSRHDGAVYTVSASGYPKVDQLLNNPNAEMMFQTPGLNKIINLRGVVNVLDNPSIRSEVLESLGERLHAFWRTVKPEGELVVLEFVFNEATYYVPMNNSRLTIDLR